MSDMYRTRTMDQISEGDIGAQLKIAGWVENIRDHGGVSFIDLRDMYGVMQVVLRDTSLLDHVRKEECLSANAFGIERINNSSAFVIPLLTNAEYPPKKLTPTFFAAASNTFASSTKSSGVLHTFPPTKEIGVIEIRLLTIGIPNSFSISFPVFTRSFATVVILL